MPKCESESVTVFDVIGAFSFAASASGGGEASALGGVGTDGDDRHVQPFPDAIKTQIKAIMPKRINIKMFLCCRRPIPEAFENASTEYYSEPHDKVSPPQRKVLQLEVGTFINRKADASQVFFLGNFHHSVQAPP